MKNGRFEKTIISFDENLVEITHLCDNYISNGKSAGNILISKFPINKSENKLHNENKLQPDSEVYTYYIDDTLKKSIISPKVVNDLHLKSFETNDIPSYTIYIKFLFEEITEEGIDVTVSQIENACDFVLGADIINKNKIAR